MGNFGFASALTGSAWHVQVPRNRSTLVRIHALSGPVRAITFPPKSRRLRSFDLIEAKVQAEAPRLTADQTGGVE